MTGDKRSEQPRAQDGAPDGQASFNPIVAAALVGGTMAAAAGAWYGTRALARRNSEKDGKPLNSVMATAITACDLAHKKQAAEPKVASEPPVPVEPRV